MSLRMPQNLSTSPDFGTGLSPLEGEIARERGAALGRLGSNMEACLKELSVVGATSSRAQLIDNAADAVWMFFVQREACGMFDHDGVIAYYCIPPEVLARVGVR